MSAKGCGATATHFALMGAIMVVAMNPLIEIDLKIFNRFIDSFAERDLVKLIEECFMEALTDTIGLRALRFGFGMIDVTHSQIQLIVMLLGLAAVFGAAIGEDSQQAHIVFLEHR